MPRRPRAGSRAHRRALARLGAVILVVLGLALVVVDGAAAQRRGRSGGSFGGGGSGWRGRPAPTSPYRRAPVGGGGGFGAPVVFVPGPGLGAPGGVGDLACIGMFLIVGIGALLVAGRVRGSALPGSESPVWNGIDLVAVQLALDWRARADMQRELARLAHRDTRSRRGLVRLLRATVHALRLQRVAWLYASVRDHRPMSPPLAESTFRRLTASARAAFEDEIVRHVEGELVTHEPPGMPEARAREEEGPGVVVVTLVVASHAEIVDVRASDARAVDRVLDALDALDEDDLVALEVVWTPAVEDDRVSTLELEARHPELRRLTDIGGRVVCAFCGGPYAMELPRCPHCGAPAPDAERLARERPIGTTPEGG